MSQTVNVIHVLFEYTSLIVCSYTYVCMGICISARKRSVWISISASARRAAIEIGECIVLVPLSLANRFTRPSSRDRPSTADFWHEKKETHHKDSSSRTTAPLHSTRAQLSPQDWFRSFLGSVRRQFQPCATSTTAS